MKNYLFLNNAAKTKKNIPNTNLSPKKVKTLAGVNFSTKGSSKTLGLQMQSVKRSRDKYDLCATTRSIDQIHCNSSIQNEQNNLMPLPDGKDDQQLFSRSYQKIAKIRQAYPHQTINKQLNEVLKMLKEQKIKIGEKIKTLKKSNEYYKQICQGANKKQVIQNAINTQSIVEQPKIIQFIDQQITCDIQKPAQTLQKIEKLDKTQKVQDIFATEAYMKLSKMLQEMNINPKNILPYNQSPSNQIPVADYKTLSDRQVIKIQRFFIKKLVQKMPK